MIFFFFWNKKMNISLLYYLLIIKCIKILNILKIENTYCKYIEIKYTYKRIKQT